MSTVWISKEAWQTVTTALRNIVVRMDRTVQTPSVRFSGAGMSARIHIDLPCTGGGDSGYDGPFALKLKTGEKKKTVVCAGGTANVYGRVYAVEPEEFAADKDGYVYFVLDLIGETATPELTFTEERLEYDPLKLQIIIGGWETDKETKQLTITQSQYGEIFLADRRYTGPFAVSIRDGKVTVLPGRVLANGSSFVTKRTTFAAKAGTICVCAKLSDNKWSAEVQFGSSDDNGYPIAEVTKTGDKTFAVEQYYVSTAVFMVGKACPLSEEQDGK